MPPHSPIVTSLNFEFLRDGWPELVILGGFAEGYAHGDPIGALTKLRMFAEQFAKWVHHKQGLESPYRPDLVDLLNSQGMRDVVPELILSKLHLLRQEGNRAVHGNQGDSQTALRATREAFNAARWLAKAYGNIEVESLPTWQEPHSGGAEGVAVRKEKRAYLERIAEQEAQLQQLLKEIEAERERAQKAESTAEERRHALDAALAAQDALKAVDPLAFNEEETRTYLIDQMLADVGWDVGASGMDTAEVRREVSVGGQSTASGSGSVDYVLYDDNGKPLAVVEAKKTAKNPQTGQTQARQYADGLEKEHGQRPVIFYTNGYELWIWNDTEREPARKIYGMYSKDSLQHLVFQRNSRDPVSEVTPDPEIAGRMYQIEAVRRVVERFAEKKRKALLVQATGTGKTRVAISLSAALIRAKWAKRVLFLCDRKTLRTQALERYTEFLGSEPRTVVSSRTAGDAEHRIYLSTYPAMMKIHESFDTGFFDLIIADESHRSLYNRYRQIFEYFDCLQVGLTATPVKFVARNTFSIFDCEEGEPTFDYPYEEALGHDPPYLVPFEVASHTTKFLRTGVKYSEMTDEQKRRLEEDEELPELVEYEQKDVDRVVFNKDTNRHVLRNLMDHGIRVEQGTRIGKSIVFARSVRHARLLKELFVELYPQYGEDFCQVVVSEDPRAESLIKDFKGEGTNDNLTIAISVDMLDTGVDVPGVVNLVFAKPVYSYVKFWQMIGRGTRLCEDLFGPGRHKTRFQIFDHWGNFERFGSDYKESQPSVTKSLPQRLFEARIELAEVAIERQDTQAFDLAVDLIQKDVNNLPEKTIAVREKWKLVLAMRDRETLEEFSAATKASLRRDVAPLMQWVELEDRTDAWDFDLSVVRAQTERLRGSNKFADRQAEIAEVVGTLRTNLAQVKEKIAVIDRVKSAEFQEGAAVADLEEVRGELRGIVHHRRRPAAVDPTRTYDILEDESEVQRGKPKFHIGDLTDSDMAAYRSRVNGALQKIIDDNETLQKIRDGQPVTEQDLDDLCSLVLTQEPGLNLDELTDYYPQAGGLAQAIRDILRSDGPAVSARFDKFIQEHPTLASHQIKFLDLLQKHIAKFGSIEISQLYDAPFTTLHSDGPDGLFDGPLVDELLDIISSFPSASREDAPV